MMLGDNNASSGDIYARNALLYLISYFCSHALECFYSRGALRAKGSRPADGLCICMVVQCDDSVFLLGVIHS